MLPLSIIGSNPNEVKAWLYSEFIQIYTRRNREDEKVEIRQDYINVDIHDKFNCRSFTNSLDNPNHALMNDSLNEFALNKDTNHDDYLAYKNVRFPVKIFDMKSMYDSLVCRGRVIDVPEDSYRNILFVATAQFGYK